LSDKELSTKSEETLPSAEDAWKDLSEKERMFAHHYLLDYNHRKAAQEVGLSPSQGIKWLRKPLISKFISHLQSEAESRSVINKDFLEAQWLQLLPKLAGEEEVDIINLKDGMAFKAKKFHSNEMVAALRELGKSSGYDQGSGQNAGVHINIDFGALGIDRPVYAEVERVDG